MRSQPGALLLAAIGLAIGACSGSKSGTDAGAQSCDCTGHICGTVCGNVCGVCPNDGVCSPDGTTCRAALPIGSACVQDIDCGEGLICITTATVNAPGGYCSAPCGGSATCPTGSVCEIGSDGNSVCLATCSATVSCRTSDGYECNSAGYCPACVGQCSGKTCGDDGCGNQCGQTSPSTPACNADDQVCASTSCGTAFTPSGQLDSASGAAAMIYNYGLFDAAAFDIDGEAVIVGGREVYQYPDALLGAVSLDSVTVFDPTTNEITNVWPQMPVSVARPQAAVLNDILYVAGGISDPMAMPTTGEAFESNDAPQSAFFNYNGVQAGNSVWNQNISQVPAPFPTGSALIALNNQLYLIGGDISGTPTTRVDVYSPVPVDEWNTPAPPPQRTLARTRFAAATDGLRIYVMGGWDGTQAIGTVEIFDPNSGWSKAVDLPQPVVDAQAIVVNGSIYVFGGRLGPSPLADVVGDIQTVNLTTHQTAVIGRTDHELSGQAAVVLRTGQVYLFGALNFDSSNMPLADTEILKFNIPQ